MSSLLCCICVTLLVDSIPVRPVVWSPRLPCQPRVKTLTVRKLCLVLKHPHNALVLAPFIQRHPNKALVPKSGFFHIFDSAKAPQ